MSATTSRIAVLAILLTGTTSGLAAAQSVLFRNARVFDGRQVLATTDVIVRDGRIAEVGRGLRAPQGATVVEASGKTLLPGFIDAHTHAFGDALRDAVIFGVTTELDMFTDASLVRTLRAEQQAGKADARADIFSAGTLVTAPGGHGTEYGVPIPTITSPDSAQAFVDARIAEGSDYIKIVYDDARAYGMQWPTINKAVMKAVIDAAHKRGKLAVVHVGSSSGARDAIEAGADGLVHLFTDAPAAPDFAQLTASKRAFVIPTLTVMMSIGGTGGGAALVSDPRIAPYLTPSARGMLSQAFPLRPGAPARDYGHAESAVRQLKAAGVPILAGTDASNPGTAHGAALHRELELLVKAGLTPVEALAAATREPAAAFRLADRGRIAAGLRADLVLVNGDPTTDITATRAIDGVWKRGVRIDRAAYAKAIVDARVFAERAAATGLVADFEAGTTAAAFGTEWILSTDSYAGGKSTAEQKVIDGGAKGSKKALRITGTISEAVPFAWAGTMWSPGPQPMSAADLSSKKELHFWARGDGKTYRVFVFSQSGGMTPRSQNFVAGTEWREVVMPWSAFGTDGRDVMAIVISGAPPAGSFSLEVDDVRIR